MAMVAAGGTAVWARRGTSPVPPAPAPTRTVTDDEEPEPVEDTAPTPAPPRRADSPTELVGRIMDALAESHDRSPEAREAAVAGMIDVHGFATSTFGGAWERLSFAQRVVALRDLRTVLVEQLDRGARAWLPLRPRVTAVEDRGATVRVLTAAWEDTDVHFVVARRPAEGAPEALGVVDVEVSGVSMVVSYRRQIERLLAKHDQDPAYVLERLARKVARLRAPPAAP